MSKEPVGSVAEEAAKLFAVLQQAAHQHEPRTPNSLLKRLKMLKPPRMRSRKSTSTSTVLRASVTGRSASGVRSAS